MHSAYKKLINEGKAPADITAAQFEQYVEAILNPQFETRQKADTLLERFCSYTDEAFRDGLLGIGRRRHYDVFAEKLRRFLVIEGKLDIRVNEFADSDVVAFRNFVLDEYLLVDKWPGLYTACRNSDIPTQRRSENTTAENLKIMRAFFAELEDRDEIVKSPFRKLGRQRRSSFLTEKYDEPFFLTLEEFSRILAADVPASLQNTKDAFLLQCAFGCRIGDFEALSMNKISVNSEGIPYIHYLPRKTRHTQKDNKEIETPIVRYALDIIKRTNFELPALRNISGHCGYNATIKKLLQHCGIDREVAIFDAATNDNVYTPLWEVASSKLCRKTHVDLMNKVQINKYAAGLHRAGSKAVDRYTSLNLQDRFILMCAAYAQPEYKTNNKLEII